MAGSAGLGRARPGAAGEARRGAARRGLAGVARQGAAWHGKAGEARLGEARLGLARQARQGMERKEVDMDKHTDDGLDAAWCAFDAAVARLKRAVGDLESVLGRKDKEE